MKREFFSCQEAFDILGNLVESQVDFSEASKGTKGKVIRSAQRDWDKWTAVVEWQLPDRTEQRWFSKDEYKKFLREIG